jgi:hypothetical protein
VVPSGRAFTDSHAICCCMLFFTLTDCSFLFIVGLELDPRLLKSNAGRSFSISLGGQSFTWCISVLVAHLMYTGIDGIKSSFGTFLVRSSSYNSSVTKKNSAVWWHCQRVYPSVRYSMFRSCTAAAVAAVCYSASTVSNSCLNKIRISKCTRLSHMRVVLVKRK